MRYFLITVAIGAFLVLGWLAVDLLMARAGPGYIVPVAVPALLMAVAAVGLVMRRSWGAYTLSAAGFLAVLPIAFLLLWAATVWRTEPDTTSDPGVLILWGALLLALTVGGSALKLGRSLGRERARIQDSRTPP